MIATELVEHLLAGIDLSKAPTLSQPAPTGAARQVVAILLGEQPAGALVEASVHLGTRSRRFVASFRDEIGQQVWRTTGLRDREAALALAREWEDEARRKRATMGARPKKPTIRVRPGGAESSLGLLSQAEVGAILGISARTVRAIEKRAFDKLRRHPALRRFWREWQTGEVQETAASIEGYDLSQVEVAALCGLAVTPQERRALRKLIALTTRGRWDSLSSQR